MQQQKILFIDRDGTLIVEPDDQQVDNIEKLAFLPNVIQSLLQLIQAGYVLVMITNQDGLGTASFPKERFAAPHELMLRIFASQGVVFEAIYICPHLPQDNCDCRKPKIGLLLDYLITQKIDHACSYIIGDRETDMELAKNIGIQGLRIGQAETPNWKAITQKILQQTRCANFVRKTNETAISVSINLDVQDKIQIDTGIGFFDHMLEQLTKHAGFGLSLTVVGDLAIDDHHTVEDTAIVLGTAIRTALGDKWGIGRYGFLLPMDESLAQVAIDLSGRSYFIFNGKFNRERVGDLATELVSHFFRSLADGLQANLHITINGENTHHMIEAIFKSVGRTLRQAASKIDNSLPTTKGLL